MGRCLIAQTKVFIRMTSHSKGGAHFGSSASELELPIAANGSRATKTAINHNHLTAKSQRSFKTRSCA